MYAAVSRATKIRSLKDTKSPWNRKHCLDSFWPLYPAWGIPQGWVETTYSAFSAPAFLSASAFAISEICKKYWNCQRASRQIQFWFLWLLLAKKQSNYHSVVLASLCTLKVLDFQEGIAGGQSRDHLLTPSSPKGWGEGRRKAPSPSPVLPVVSFPVPYTSFVPHQVLRAFWPSRNLSWVYHMFLQVWNLVSRTQIYFGFLGHGNVLGFSVPFSTMQTFSLLFGAVSIGIFTELNLLPSSDTFPTFHTQAGTTSSKSHISQVKWELFLLDPSHPWVSSPLFRQLCR